MVFKRNKLLISIIIGVILSFAYTASIQSDKAYATYTAPHNSTATTNTNTPIATPPGCYMQTNSNGSNGSPQTQYIAEDNSSCSTGYDTAHGVANDPTQYCYVLLIGQTSYTPCQQSLPAASITGFKSDTTSSKNQCGSGSDAIATSINFGCKGEACRQSGQSAYCQGTHSAVIDLIFAIIRFLSYGVGFIIVASIVVAGIQYTTSEGDPKATENAEKRIKSTVTALILFIFAYAILNYVIPAGFFSQ